MKDLYKKGKDITSEKTQKVSDTTADLAEPQGYTAPQGSTEYDGASEAEPVAAESASNVADRTEYSAVMPDVKMQADTYQAAENNMPRDMNQASGTVPKSVEDASKAYGKQAGAFIATYEQGQDAAQYDAAYRTAFEIGKAYGSDRGTGSLSLDRVKGLEEVSYLTDSQVELAYRAGVDASVSAASELEAGIQQGRNGKTGWRRGVVRGENGITGRELQKAYNLNPQQVRAYDIFSAAAELTGIDIVLYSSKQDEYGNFIGEEGKYNSKREPGCVYIDINSGLENINDAKDLFNYAMGRTFGHEFMHFLERWNPTEYNEFRRLVLDTVDKNADVRGGSTAAELIQEKMEAEALGYDAASREVAAEAMADVIPQSSFMQELAEKHRNIFEKLLEKLKELAAKIREYWNSLKADDSTAAKSVKEAVGEALQYTDELVQRFDSMAVKAVENYQSNYAVDDTESPVQTEAARPSADAEVQAPKVTESKNGYTITDNPEYGSIEIKFKDKPSEEVRSVLKENKFRWHGKKKVWYGKSEHDIISAKLDNVYSAKQANKADAGGEVKPETDFKTVFDNATRQEKDEVIQAIHDNTRITHMYPTEVYEASPAQAEEIKEESTNGENETDEGAVHQPESDGDGAAQLLEGLQAEAVQGAGGQRGAVAADKEQGGQAERNGDRADAADRTGGSKGDGQSGDLRRDDGLRKPKEGLKEEAARQVEQQSAAEPRGSNFVIGDSLSLPSGEKARFKANTDAIRLIKQLQTEGRGATAAEQEALAKYVGWGGLSNAFGELRYNPETHRSEMTAKAGWEKEFAELRQLVADGVITEEEYQAMSASTKNAHYTSVEVIKAMYGVLKQLGFAGGRMLEPAAGVGNFVGAMPADMSAGVKSWTMVELDRITGQLAKYLYPNADVRIQGFEEANIPDSYMDAAIGNVPFGSYGVVDRNYPKRITKSIHNYFFAKTLDKVRTGGIVMFITSRFTMDSGDSSVREYIAKKADLLGAVRLPNTAFAGNAGTQVVTDILVLKKRAIDTEYAGEAFTEAPRRTIQGSWQAVNVNEYFDNHPEMVLGTESAVNGMYGNDSLTYTPLEGRGTLGQQIEEAFKGISGRMDYNTPVSSEKANFASERAGKKTKEGGLEVKNGRVYRNVNGILEAVDRDAERVSGLLGIRDAYRTLINDLQQGVKKAEITKARSALNKAYDDFVKKYGPLNSPKNKAAISDDPDQYSVLSLESYDAKKKKAVKADIFTKDTITPIKTITHVDDMASGVVVSINRTGGIDTSLIAQITGKAEESVVRELIDSRMAFKTKSGGLEAPEVYLSGNVRAKLREAEALAPIDRDFQNNVDELKKVVPKDIPYNEIYAALGTPWIPNSVYADFIAEMLGGSNNGYSGPDITVGRTSGGDFKLVVNNSRLKTRYQNTQQWGTYRKSFLDIVQALMTSGSIRVNDYVEDVYGRKKAVLNKVETAAAQAKAEEITKRFQEWLWQDESRKKELAYLYNETFNALVTPKYNGKNLTVNGINAEYQLREHQANAVQRIISSGGNTLLAHRVGAGKTLEMAAAAMKLRELGVVKKPMFVVPKALVAQWGTEFKSYFPAARLLVSDEQSFTPANRKTYVNRIANVDYDAVILSYEQFEKIPMSAEYQKEFYQQQIQEIIDAIAEEKAESKNGRGITVKEMEKKKAQLTKKIAELTSKPKDENNISFEALGVDSLFVDEAHSFKNLQYTTRMTNVSGLGNSNGSGRSFDLYTKIRYLQGLNGGRGIVFATATPVMNSMSEMYIIQKYLQNDTLNRLGLKSFDAWAKQFGEIVNTVEIKPSGQGFRVNQAFSKFRNLNELQLLFRSFSDVLTEVPGLKIPKMKGGRVKVVECEMGQFQKNYMQELERRAENVKNVDPKEDNMLKITSDGRKIAYTQRMIDPSLPYEPGCKIFRCCDNVLAEYKESSSIRGTQLVFCDMATPKGKTDTKKNSVEGDEIALDENEITIYDDIKAYLVKRGIPAEEIAFIHDAKTDARKKQLFEDVNNGKVRVLIGSTGKMGVGMNAQERVVAIHHLDAPWRPGDVEQRDGRAFRQKNMNEEVSKYVYVTTGSFDARMWDILDRKQQFINQIMNGEDVGRSAEDTGNVTLSAAEVKAIASGNPLIMEQVQLTNDLAKLQDLKRAHNTAVITAQAKLLSDEQRIGELSKNIENGRADIKARTDAYKDGSFSMTVGKRTFTDKKEAGTALAAAIIAKAKPEVFTDIGRFAGFRLRAMKQGSEYIGHLTGQQAYRFNVYTENTTRMVNHIAGVAEKLEDRVSHWESALEETKTDLEAQNRLIAQPFAKQDELNQKLSRYNEIMSVLNPKEDIIADEDDSDGTQYKRRNSKDDNDYGLVTEIHNDVREEASSGVAGRESEASSRDTLPASSEMGSQLGWRELEGKKREQITGLFDTYVQLFPEAEYYLGFPADDDSRKKSIEKMAKQFYEGMQGNRVLLENNPSFGWLGPEMEYLIMDIEAIQDGTFVDNPEEYDDDDTQYKSRTRRNHSDVELLTRAAETAEYASLTDSEKEELREYKERSIKIREAAVTEWKLEKLYEEQLTTDPEEAKKTLERLERSRAWSNPESEKLFELRSKGVTAKILRATWDIVMKEQWKKDEEKLKRWRDRRNNAAGIKKYRERIRKDVDELTGWILRPDNKSVVKHIPDAIKSPVIQFLMSIDFTSKRQLSGGEPTKADAQLVKRLEQLEKAMTRAASFDMDEAYAGLTLLKHKNFNYRIQQ